MSEPEEPAEEGTETVGKRKEDQHVERVRHVAVTGRPLPMDFSPKDAERLLDPPPPNEPNNLNLPEEHN